MQLSVIILNYNVRWFLHQCLLSVEKALSGMDAEIIVVDNNSSDGSREMVRKDFPNAILIANTENFGFPKGNNIGVSRAAGKYVCILNPDTVVAEDTFIKSIAFAEKQEKFGIAGVRLIDGTGKFLPESKRGIPTPLTAFTKVTGLYKVSSKLFGKYYASHLNQDESGAVDILVGAFMLMERDLYQSIGGFDENCFMYSDDIDLSYMVLKSGRKNYYFAHTAIIHYKGESTIRDENYMRRFREAMNFFYRKHFRISPAFDIFMKTGAAMFSLMKKSVVVEPFKILKLVVCGDETLANNIAAAYDKPVALFSAGYEPTKGDCIVLNPSLETYAGMISKMQLWHDKGITFRIVHEREQYVIGSDSSNSRGEVVLLDGNTVPMV